MNHLTFSHTKYNFVSASLGMCQQNVRLWLTLLPPRVSKCQNLVDPPSPPKVADVINERPLTDYFKSLSKLEMVSEEVDDLDTGAPPHLGEDNQALVGWITTRSPGWYT